MEFGSVSGEQWAIIATAATAVGGGLWRFVSWLKGRGAAFLEWAKPQVDGMINDHRSLVRTLELTQVAGQDRLNAIDGHLATHTEILTRIDKQTCPKPTESNA